MLRADPVLRPNFIIIGANGFQIRIGAKWPQGEQFKKCRYTESLAKIEIETVGRCDQIGQPRPRGGPIEPCASIIDRTEIVGEIELVVIVPDACREDQLRQDRERVLREEREDVFPCRRRPWKRAEAGER